MWFWVWILVAMLVVVGASVLIGKTLTRRNTPTRRLSREEQLQMAKASGAFPQRKESHD